MIKIPETKEFGKSLLSKLSENTFLLFLVTINAMVGIYYYELGFCRFFGIPEELISIEISKHVWLIFLFSVVFYYVYIILIFIISENISLLNKCKIKSAMLIAFVTALMLIALIYTFTSKIYLLDIMPPLLTLLFGIVYYLKNKVNKPDDI